jgi:hypothetical protein
MQNIDKLNPPIQYKLIWFIIGLCLVGAIIIWYCVALWITRRKKPKSLDGLKQLQPHLNLDQLKAKYLQIIQDLYQSHMRQEITLRMLHHELSMAVRNFVYEANYFPAPYLTLSDLRMSPYPQLANLIASYYPEEFAEITEGNAESSVQAAQGVVAQWPY